MENTIITQFLSISIVGAAMSFMMQWLKNKYGVSGSQTKAIAIVGSVILGGAIWFLSTTPVWATILGVLASASTVYALLFSGNK